MSNQSTASSYLAELYVCEYIIWKDFYEFYWIFIDASIYSFIPSVLIFILNILMIGILKKAEKKSRNLNEVKSIKRNSLEMVSML
jgi:hypothetical protein